LRDDPKIDSIIELIKEGLCKVPQEYFKLKVKYKRDTVIVRERIFCYELYHIMRQLQADKGFEDTFILHGEIDKSGHPEFDTKHRFNPDFVFHVPGTMRDNSVVVEVKGILNFPGVKKDLRTLHTFTKSYLYKAGVFILYNYSMDEFIGRITNHIVEMDEYNDDYNTLIMCKKSFSAPLECRNLSEILLEINS
jgi:hypothetical protein